MRKIQWMAALLLALPALGAVSGAHEVSILVSGEPRTEYAHHGKTYVEALRGRDFTIRLTNPTPYRVAVALSVDGLNTIDAKHTDAWSAAKWVLEPYETADIDGWQVSDSTARRFFFTGESRSYGAALGQTENLGIIEAVFYRERNYEVERRRMQREAPPAPSSMEEARPDDDYAATGMGSRTDHEVERVNVDLERQPVAMVSIRYEFRPQLVKLGVLPQHPNPLGRRERAQGFAYCPEE